MKTIKFSLILLAFMAFAQTTWAQSNSTEVPCLPGHGETEDQSAWCGGVQEIALSAGWNWVSTYIEMEGVDGLGMLKEGLGANGLYIQNGLLYTESWEEDGVVYWYGSLDEEAMRNETMYMVQVAADCSVTLEGVLADPAAHPITINPGWNWIGFPCDHAMSIEEAFANFTVADGDAIQQGISYSDALVDEEGVLWFGSVRELRPGQGFMYYSASSGVKTLVFGTVSSAKRNR